MVVAVVRIVPVAVAVVSIVAVVVAVVSIAVLVVAVVVVVAAVVDITFKSPSQCSPLSTGGQAPTALGWLVTQLWQGGRSGA